MVTGSKHNESILEVILKHESVTDADVARELPHTTAEQRAHAFNALLSSSKIQLVGNDFDNPRYRGFAREEAIKVKGLGAEDMLVYQVISQAGNVGIWTRDMKQRTNLPQGKITKILKLLEERGLVKAIKSIQNASRKVYMLSSLEPAKEITGGPWYGSDQQPDKAFIETIRTVVSSFVERSGPVTLEAVAQFIQQSGISSQPLQQEDVASILKTLCYDSVLEKIFRVSIEGIRVEKYRKANTPTLTSTPLTSVPCGVCPVFTECHEGGAISPERCQYYTMWFGQLDF